MITFSILLQTSFFYFLTSCAILMATPLLLISALLPARWRYTNPLLKIAYYLIYKSMVIGAWVKIEINGKEHIPKGPIILAANHQSAIDIPMLGLLFSMRPHIWFFKKELKKIPLLGWIGKRLSVSVDRSSPRRSVRTLSEGLRLITAHHLSLGIFPEGARHADGKVHDFLWGFAIIAKKTNLPVVPVLIQDAYKVYPRESFFLHNAPIRVTVGKPFIYSEYESDAVFRERVHEWFVTQSER